MLGFESVSVGIEKGWKFLFMGVENESLSKVLNAHLPYLDLMILWNNGLLLLVLEYTSLKIVRALW